MERELSSNKLGTEKMSKLVVSMAGPIIISMLVQALYNIVDTMFVSSIEGSGAEAISALSLAFPWQNILISTAVGTGVGMNALLSRRLGQKQYDDASRVAGVGLLLYFISWVAILIATVAFVAPFVSFQVSANADTTGAIDISVVSEYTREYLYIVSGLSVGVMFQVYTERLLQSTGKTVLSMIVQLSGALTNIILDPILIFVFDMGVAGAAIATVAGQFVSATIGFVFNLKFNKDISLSFKNVRFDGAIIKKVYSVAVPSIVMSSIGSIMTTSMNMILLSIKQGGKTAMAVFGIYFKLLSFVNMPAFGLNNGMVPIIAYNYGARNKKRIIQAIKVACVYVSCIMLVGTLIFQLLPNVLINMFNQPELVSTGVTALRILSTPFMLAGFCIVLIGSFQALESSIYSVVISICRQLGALIPLAYLFSLSGDVSLVWWAFPLAEVVSVILCFAFMRRVYLKKIKPLDQ